MIGRFFIILVFLCAAVLVNALSACGRRGSLEPPPPRATITDTSGHPVKKPVKDKPFIFDKLIK